MLDDARKLAAGTEVQADICIIGAGPAGATLAIELAALGRKVLVLEAGGLQDNPARNALAAPADGFRYGTEKTLIQHQRFGGNANAWHIRTPAGGDFVRFAAYRDADFEDRADFPDSGWPFRAEALQSSEQRAAEIWNIGPDGYRAAGGLPDFGPDMAHASYRFPSARKVTQDFRETLSASSEATVLLNAVVTRLDFENGKAVRARIMTEAGHQVFARAGTFVIASGALNACRLLFNSKQPEQPAPGNRHDVLGRYLMDHPGIHGGVFYPADPGLFDAFSAFDIHDADGSPAMAHTLLSDERLLQGGVLGLASQFFPRAGSWRWDHVESFRRNDAVRSMIALRSALERRKLPAMRDSLNVLAGLDAVIPHLVGRAVTPPSSMGRGGWSRRAGASKRYSVFEVIQSAEQAPHPDNRVLPHGEIDAFGQNRITLDWRWHESDQDKVIAAQNVFETAVAASGLGHIDHARPEGRLRIITTSSHHHIGGLRMGRDTRTSVTDGHGRVHDTANLYVAGAGLFPTGSHANPTWLIAVLAVRLARHLAGRAAGSGRQPAEVTQAIAV